MSTQKQISPGEISVGQILTVLEWEPVVHEADGFLQTVTVTHRDNSWKGDLLKVLAVDLPFIACEEVKGHLGSAIKLDTRRVKLMEPSKEYIEALTRKIK